MRPEVPKLLEDIRDAAAFILDSVAGRSLDEFRANRLLYQAVERNFEIIGEAINRLARTDPDTADRIGQYPQIVAFRNILVHGYDAIDRRVVWEVIQNSLPRLKRDVETLLAEAEGQT